MKKILLLTFLIPLSASAYIPPSFLIYSRIAEQREQAPAPALTLLVSRPASGGTEESLGTIQVQGWPAEDGAWPSLSLLFASKPDELMGAVEKFGLTVFREQDLLRVSKEQAAAMKEPPRPFYKNDKTMGLKRQRGNYAWVHTTAEKSIWIEKDSFIPLKIAAPCPKQVNELPWAKSGEGKCELEFRNAWSLRKGTAPVGAKMILMKDGQPLLYYSFERISYPKAPLSSSLEVTLPDEIRDISNALLH